MTATPIPRSLALAVYSDMELSLMQEKPIKKAPPKTLYLEENQKSLASRLLDSEIAQGRQGFVVAPRIDQQQSETLFNLRSIEEIAAEYRQALPTAKIGVFHGRLKPETADKIMQQFINGELDILVATSIIEVGIDIPNATVMVIESADWFGLAQLHQLRGRIGRGQNPGTCFVIPNLTTEESKERLRAFTKVADGKALAELDLKLRGPGDLIGELQAGNFKLNFATLTDAQLLTQAKRLASEWYQNPPNNLYKWRDLWFKKDGEGETELYN
jgi:ATP-dependent DNA helicase RecG